MALKAVFLLLITLVCLMNNYGTTHATRELPIKPGFDLARRLEESGGIVECWNALMELRSCSNEIVVFFFNGQTDISPECCHAISIITRNCWSSMLTSLGFTVEEGNILRGYCDASTSSGPVASSPLLAYLPMKSLSSPNSADRV